MLPDTEGLVEKVSSETGKDLTECKRPDGSHLYTEQDLWILIARLAELAFNEYPGNLLSVFHTDDVADGMIRDFERRFDCKFADVKKANPNIRPGGSNVENENLIIQYASLEYSG